MAKVSSTVERRQKVLLLLNARGSYVQLFLALFAVSLILGDCGIRAASVVPAAPGLISRAAALRQRQQQQFFKKSDPQWEDLGWAWGKRSDPEFVLDGHSIVARSDPVYRSFQNKNGPDWQDLGWAWGKRR